MKQILFPSVIEGHNSELRNVAPDLLNGIKIYDQGTGYIVGELALREGTSPHKAINSSPQDLDYKLLLESALLLASTVSDGPLSLTLGFPYATFQVNRDKVAPVVELAQEITYDAAPFGGRGKQIESVQIDKLDVLPEIVGSIIGARKGPRRQTGSFFLVSLGYGTCEACLSTEDGIVQRTMVSTSGLRYAIDLAMKELMETHYLGLRTEHQFDAAFQRGKVILNRQGVDLRPVRRRAVLRYYEDVISPTLRNSWTDQDFERGSTLLLTGGGALYEELVNAFIEEFGGLMDVEVVDDPMSVASIGFCIRATSLGSSNSVAVGVDIGNAHTALAMAYKSEKKDEDRAKARLEATQTGRLETTPSGRLEETRPAKREEPRPSRLEEESSNGSER